MTLYMTATIEAEMKLKTRYCKKKSFVIIYK